MSTPIVASNPKAVNVRLQTANKDQLLAYLHTVLAVPDANDTMTNDQLRALICEAGGIEAGAMIQIPAVSTGAGMEKEPDVDSDENIKRSFMDQLVVIQIAPSADIAADGDAVPIGLNGVVIVVPRGKYCAIPRKYALVLKDAVRVVYDPLKKGGLAPPRNVTEYPYQLFGRGSVPEEEVLVCQTKRSTVTSADRRAA